ncbi:MAG TPA: potassium-transporting ATPase subunit KdpA [Candidatus Kapabacteria bacterium]|nr:potassium-transporting ATPase subunit KdpA [Candidatus Kapabacteria bacterium]
MTFNGILQILLFFGLVLLLVKPLGAFMARVFNGERTFLHPVLGPVERFIYRISGVDPNQEQHWTTYTIGMLLFSLVGLLLLYGLQRLQGVLPLNPQGLGAVAPDLAFNTAVSFTTNTNWQAYSGESTMSYLVQMAGLAFHNFVSAATGIVLAIALIRGFARHSMQTIGNFWADLVRCTLYVLLPLCVIGALVLVWQGVPQNFSSYTDVTTIEGAKQTIAQGPVASQEIIKQLGTNGGGFFNANSAHPYENPTPLSNLIAMVAIFALGGGLTYTMGRMVGNQRQGWAIFAAMSVLFFMGIALLYPSETHMHPAIEKSGANIAVVADPGSEQAGGNMEGKEVRFGIANSALFATATTDASCGAVNSMHDSFTPLGGMVPLLNIELGEVIFGGVGSGMYGFLLFAILSVFIAGLMVGRTPEYLGKKIESREMKMTVLALVLILPLSILGFTALASVHPDGLKGPLNAGAHGFSEILYAFVSGTGNNGSAFAGLSANTMFYNITIALAMLFGRFLFIVPAMAVAGSLAQKKIHPPSSGTFPTTGWLWVGLLVAVILIVGGLTFFPALALGPIVEHLQMMAGKIF